MNEPILFTVLDDQVILRNSRGVYRQAKLALRRGNLFAQIGGGFVMLYANGTTSTPTTRWEEIETPMAYTTGKLGRLVCVDIPQIEGPTT